MIGFFFLWSQTTTPKLEKMGEVDFYPYNYSFVFFFEEKYFDEAYMNNLVYWINQNWTWSIFYAFAYVLLVYAGQKWMAKREKFHLYRSLVAWNIVLAIFSILGAFRFLPNFITVLSSQGITTFGLIKITTKKDSF